MSISSKRSKMSRKNWCIWKESFLSDPPNKIWSFWGKVYSKYILRNIISFSLTPFLKISSQNLQKSMSLTELGICRKFILTTILLAETSFPWKYHLLSISVGGESFGINLKKCWSQGSQKDWFPSQCPWGYCLKSGTYPTVMPVER